MNYDLLNQHRWVDKEGVGGTLALRSAHDALLADGAERDGERDHRAEWLPKVEVEVVRTALAMAEGELFDRFLSVLDRAD